MKPEMKRNSTKKKIILSAMIILVLLVFKHFYDTKETISCVVDSNTKVECKKSAEVAPACESDKIFIKVDDMPKFKGCEDDVCTQAEIMRYIGDNIVYPAKAKEKNITGKVFVNFVVDQSGEVTGVELIKSVDADLDNEALRVIRSLPLFRPGKQDGETVNVQYCVPISFRLS